MKKKVSNLKINPRRSRNFSETFKRNVVDDLLAKVYTFSEAGRMYDVSTTSLYRWLYKYSPNHSKGVRVVVEMESEAAKTKRLMDRVAELERVVGRKQMELDFQDELIKLASEHFRIDLKKSFSPGQSKFSEPDSPNVDMP